MNESLVDILMSKGCSTKEQAQDVINALGWSMLELKTAKALSRNLKKICVTTSIAEPLFRYELEEDVYINEFAPVNIMDDKWSEILNNGFNFLLKRKNITSFDDVNYIGFNNLGCNHLVIEERFELKIIFKEMS